MKYYRTEDAADIYVELMLPRGSMKNEMISWRAQVPKNPVVLLMESILLIKRNLILKMTDVLLHFLLVKTYQASVFYPDTLNLY